MRSLKLWPLLLALAAAPVTAEDVQVVLKPAAVVGGGSYTLGDVAAISGPELDAVRRLTGLPIGRGPRTGQAEVRTREEVERLVRLQAPGIAVAWSGEAQVRVESQARLYAASAVVDEAARFLNTLLAAGRDEFAISPLEVPPDFLVPEGRVELRPRQMRAADALRQRVAVWVDVLADGRFLRAVAVPFAVEVRREVWVARSDLQRADTPRCQDLELRRVDIAGLPAAPFEGRCDNGPLRLKRGLRAGEVLLAGAVETVPDVLQGSAVRLQLRDGVVAIEAAAVALSDGRTGQRIPVRPLAGTEPVYAQVMGSGQVAVLGR